MEKCTFTLLNLLEKCRSNAVQKNPVRYNIDDHLRSNEGKILLIEGARQIGKYYIIRDNMLPYSTYYTTTIRDNHSDVLIYYVDKYLDECIGEIEKLPTDMRLYKHLMRNPRVIAEKSLCVVQPFLPHIVWDNELANITLPVVKNNIEKFDYDTEKKILSTSTNLQERLSFLIDLIEKYKDDFKL